MDISEQYINMCRRAKELQEMWEPATGDYCASSAGGCNRILVVIADLNNKFLVVAYPYATYDNTDHLSKQNIIWLPRIDQWLQILSDKNIIFGLSNYAQGDSVEITCIKLLCLNIYNKYWNGEDWI